MRDHWGHDTGFPAADFGGTGIAALLLRRLGWPASLLRSQYLPEHSLQLDQELLPAQRPAGSLVQAQFVDLLRIAVIEE